MHGAVYLLLWCLADLEDTPLCLPLVPVGANRCSTDLPSGGGSLRAFLPVAEWQATVQIALAHLWTMKLVSATG